MPLPLPSLISQAVGQFSRQFSSQDPATTAAVRVLGLVQEHLFGRWAQAAQANIRCSVRFVASGRMTPCRERMAGTCVACGGPVCLGHSAVTIEGGDLVCYGCVEVARQVRIGQPPPKANESEEEERALRRKYMRWLKLKGSPTEEEIKAAWKREAAKTHPDRMPADKREAAEKRFKELGHARDWLVARAQRRAA